MVGRLVEHVGQVACGTDHTLVLTVTGLVYAMGSNAHGQLGIHRGPHAILMNLNLPENVMDLNFQRIVKIRAGLFSAALTEENELFVWGKGAFG